MNCWHCRSVLIWGGDHDYEDGEGEGIVSNFSCPSCPVTVYVYLPFEPEHERPRIDDDGYYTARNYKCCAPHSTHERGAVNGS